MLNLFLKIKTDNSDEQLYMATINGCETMFDQLYKRYNKRLLYYFYRMLGNDEQLAQDFLQELFFKILNKPEQFNPNKKFSTWVFSIAHNMCKNEYRSREVRKIMVSNENLDSYTSVESQDVKYEENVIKQIYSELEKLDESHRTAFLLKYREGFDINEISQILQLPQGTVKSRLHYTRKRLCNLVKNRDQLLNY